MKKITSMLFLLIVLVTMIAGVSSCSKQGIETEQNKTVYIQIDAVSNSGSITSSNIITIKQ